MGWGGDVSAFSGVFTIITAFIVVAVLGFVVGAIILIVWAIKKHMAQNKVIEKYCVKCGARLEKGSSFCTQCGATMMEQNPLEERSDCKDIDQ